MRNILGLLILHILFNACVSEEKQFTKLSPSSTKIYFNNKLEETNSRNYFTNPYMYLGAGVAAGD